MVWPQLSGSTRAKWKLQLRHNACSRQLRRRVNSFVMIEHNLDVIKTVDWILDLGRDGGVRGGEAVAQGAPEEGPKLRAPIPVPGFDARVTERGSGTSWMKLSIEP